jgi:hypothetical protein
VDRSYSRDQVQLSRKELRRLFSQTGLADVEIRPQGIFSTPFAELPLKPDWLVATPSRVACWLDGTLERAMGSLLLPLSWNLVAVGRRPAGGSDAASP